MITRPVRERPAQQVRRMVSDGLARTGYDEVSLTSLSSADYSGIESVVGDVINDPMCSGQVSVSLPSLRVDAFTVGVATAAGFRVGFPKGQWCCGLIAANAGDFSGGAELHGDLAQSLGDSKGPIVTPSASCFGAFTIDAPDWGAPVNEALRSRMRDSTRFTLELLIGRPELVQEPGLGLKVAYHDSCQTLRQLGLKAEPRRLLGLAGYEVVDIPDIANCCGFGGTFSLDWPRVASRLADWKLDAIAKTGCTVVASDNPGCLIHIAGAARRRGIELRVAHVLELVAERLTTSGR